MHDHDIPPCPDERQLDRPRYFQGQLLAEADFSTEQAYMLDKLRSHNRLLHGSGTVCGLAVEPTEPPSEGVVVQPGVAIDCCGREIVVTEPIEVDHDALLNESRRPGPVYVTLAYGEVAAAAVPVPGEPDGDASQASRVREVPNIGVGVERPHPPHDATSGPRPCPPCIDPRVVLAAIDLSHPGPITADAIDNAVRRPIGEHSRIGGEPERPGRRRVSLRTAMCAVVGAAVISRLVTHRRH